MAEITQYGLERENYTTLLEDIKQRFRAEFGRDAGLEDSDPLGQISALLAKLQNDNLNLLEALWASRKLTGAEGIYLDDIFGRMGVFRRGKQAGSGIVLLETDENTPNNFLFPTTTNVTASNGKNYNVTEDVLLVNHVAAYKLDRSEITLNQQYDVTLTDTTDGIQYPFTYTPEVDADRDLMLSSLESFWRQHTTGNDTIIGQSGGVLYIGYDLTDLSVQGITESTEFTISPTIGIRHSSVSVLCSEVGYFPVQAGEVTGVSPEFTGFVSATNPVALAPGSEVESDAAYRSRYFVEIEESKSGTRDSVVAAVTEVSGVTKVKIYDNPTATDTTEAEAHSFNTVVLGGVSAEIARAIYDIKPINTGTSGTLSNSINTADGATEVVRHSNAVQVPLNLKVKYSTADQVPVNDVEKSSIAQALADYLLTLNIGDVLYNTRVLVATLGATGASRFISAEVDMKLQSEADTFYSRANRTPNFNEIYTLTTADVIFSQEL